MEKHNYKVIINKKTNHQDLFIDEVKQCCYPKVKHLDITEQKDYSLKIEEDSINKTLFFNNAFIDFEKCICVS